MSVIHEIDMANIYANTTAILGTASLIMGTTLFLLRNTLKDSGLRSESGLAFLAAAMFVLSVINLFEYAVGTESLKERNSLSIVIFAASIELFLMFMAYMSMLCENFVTRKRIYFEIGCILVFTTPSLFISHDSFPLLFNIFFAIGLIYYCSKLLLNYIVYKREINKTKDRIKNLLSDDSKVWLQWLNSTFYIVMFIGIISIAVPMTNLSVLVFYNSFLFFAYFYVYVSVVRKLTIFDQSMAMLYNEENASIENGNTEEYSSQTNTNHKPPLDFMDSRQKLLDEWIANRGYAVVGITASEVAQHLKTNRTRLSYYLKNNLKTTYYDWIAKLRIDDAKRQLRDYPNRTIYEIALSVGIEDRDNFRHVFQKNVGVSPSAYRNQKI